MSRSFLNKDEVKFLQKNKRLLDKNAAKNMERDSDNAYVHMRHDTPSPCT